MTIELPADLIESVRAEVQSGRYASEVDLVAEAVRVYLARQGVQVGEAMPTGEASPRKPLWERVAELRQSVPNEVWSQVPVDGSRQLDHYLHGTPKRGDA